MKAKKNGIVIILLLALLSLIWAPTFISPALGVESAELPVSSEVQIQLNLLASSGLVLLVGIYFWIQSNRK